MHMCLIIITRQSTSESSGIARTVSTMRGPLLTRIRWAL